LAALAFVVVAVCLRARKGTMVRKGLDEDMTKEQDIETDSQLDGRADDEALRLAYAVQT
jgi:hypothetical protein